MEHSEQIDRIEDSGLIAGAALILLFVFSLLAIASIFIGG